MEQIKKQEGFLGERSQIENSMQQQQNACEYFCGVFFLFGHFFSFYFVLLYYIANAIDLPTPTLRLKQIHQDK